MGRRNGNPPPSQTSLENIPMNFSRSTRYEEPGLQVAVSRIGNIDHNHTSTKQQLIFEADIMGRSEWKSVPFISFSAHIYGV